MSHLHKSTIEWCLHTVLVQPWKVLLTHHMASIDNPDDAPGIGLGAISHCTTNPPRTENTPHIVYYWLCCHLVRPGQAGELVSEEADEVQQGQVQGPAPGEEQPHAPVQAGTDLLESSSVERDWECWGMTV